MRNSCCEYINRVWCHVLSHVWYFFVNTNVRVMCKTATIYVYFVVFILLFNSLFKEHRRRKVAIVGVCLYICMCVCDFAMELNISPNFCLNFFLPSFNIELLKSQFFFATRRYFVLRKRILFLHNKSEVYVKPLFAHVFFSNVFSLLLVLLLE
jgi:hypothetical protein